LDETSNFFPKFWERSWERSARSANKDLIGSNDPKREENDHDREPTVIMADSEAVRGQAATMAQDERRTGRHAIRHPRHRKPAGAGVAMMRAT